MSNNLSKDYENILLLGDFNITPENQTLRHFTDSFNLENLIHEATCFKGLSSCIHLIITSRKSHFKNTCVTATGMSAFHKPTAVGLKSQVLKSPPKCKFYRNFDEDNFNKDLKLKLDSLEELDYSLFENTFIDVLNTHAPIKTKTLRANSHQFMTKALRKAIMTRSRLKNIYLKGQNEENWVNYKRQRNFCTNLLRKTKQKYFCNLNMK